MTRRRIRHAKIVNETKRTATFGRRVDGFLKKANEYSTLCGVDMGIIIQKQEGQDNPIMWPSPEIFEERLQNFLDIPSPQRTRKMVPHEKLLEQLIVVETGNLSKLKERVQAEESHQLMNQVMHGKHLDELNYQQLNCLRSLSNEMLARLVKREAELINEQQLLDSNVIVTDTSSSPSTLIECMRNDQWFIESMSQEHNIAGLLGVSSNSGGGGDVEF